MSRKKGQLGVGMMEVLIALLLLAIGVMGFVGLQVRASTAGSEAFERTQAMAIAQDLAERVRLNMGQITFYTTATNWGGATALDACETKDCTPADLAKYDIDQVTNSAATLLPSGQIRMQECLGSTAGNVFNCIYVSWNDTQPTVGDGATDCVTSKGRYRDGATCVMMEAY